VSGVGSFFIRAALGEYVVNTPEQLVQLLVRMAHTKVADLVRKERMARELGLGALADD
jgi:hypothetical protein